ncbi:hypothetical protein IPN35_02990 [Candidatus Peregrinibacteria bacterium]|nr:MAG: hypothetical protein IPN35_02990 [Candidatus Peregrinibacteria bacterium]
MKEQNRKLLIAILIFLAFVGILWWFFWGNRGMLSISGNPPFLVDASHFRTFSCTENPCLLHIPQGERRFCLSKKNYEAACEEMSIPWRKTISWSPVLQKIPMLSPLSPEKIPKPQNDTLSVSLLDKSQYQFQKENETVVHLLPNGETEKIGKFFNINPLSLLPFGNDLLLQTPDKLFLILVQKKRKYEIASGKDMLVRVMSPEILFFEKEDTLFSFTKTDILPKKLPFFFPLDHIALCKEDALFFSDIKNEEARFGSMDISGERIREIFHGKLSSKKEFRLECGENENELLILFGEEGYALTW